jgi:hypothetical protein
MNETINARHPRAVLHRVARIRESGKNIGLSKK